MKKFLTDVKSFVTITMTILLGIMVIVPLARGQEIPKEVLVMFCTDMGMIFTFFFTKKKETNGKDDSNAEDN